MRYSLTKDQLHHFSKEGIIEFADLLSDEEKNGLHHLKPGYDRFLEHPFIVKIAKRLAPIAKELFQSKALFLLYDISIATPLPEEALKEIASFDKVSGAIVLPFDEEKHVLFCAAHQTLPPLFPCLILILGPKNAVYIKNEKDPFNHELKRRGMVFGDHVQENLQPLLLR